MKYLDASKPWDPRANPQRSAIDTRSLEQIYGVAAASSGKLPPPANAAAAAGNSPLNVPQAAMVVGEPIPVIWGRRRGTVGGVLVFPRATEARFENTSTTVSSRYHMVIGEGRIPDIQRKDVRLGECRIGTYSQNYNQRAGTFTPGNFATAQTGYTVPTFPNFTGGGGNYQGLSTFEAGATFTGGSDDWRTGWNIFLRGGTVVERGRLLDSTVDSSDNIADLVLWALQRSGRVPDALIDLTSLTAAARFTEAVGLWCNGEFNASGNLGDWLIRILPDFLLRETKVGGKFGLRPLLPVNSDGTINTGAIAPEWVLTEAAIIPDSYSVDYSEAASRRPVAMAMLWRQQQDDTDVPIPRTLSVGDLNASGPTEQHDLSQFATSENHAAKVGAYLYSRRTLSTHTATVRLKPGNQTGTIAEGDVVQLYLQVETSREPASVINRFYVVESISHALTGEETLQLSHFPVNSSGQSLIALAVAGATAPGVILASNRTGSSCDLAGASTSTTVPSKSTSGTPISQQTTGGSNSSSYWAATGQFLGLFGDGSSSDSPPKPGGGGSARGSAGNPYGALPVAGGSGTNAAGGDARCPYGYAPFDPDAFAYYRIIINGGSPGGWRPTATDYPIAKTYSSLITPELTSWPGTIKFCTNPSNAIGGSLVDYTYKNKQTGAVSLNSWSGVTGAVGGSSPCVTGPAITYEFANSSSATTALAKWSGSGNIDTTLQTGYTCKTADGSAGTPVIANLRTVVKGDTLWDLAQAVYGDPTRWPEIYAANTAIIGSDPDLIFPGQVLRIP